MDQNLQELSKEQLIQKVHELNTYIKELKQNIENNCDNFNDIPFRKQHYSLKAFDFSRYKKRHVAFKLLYLGWDYQGFVMQKHTNKTIEKVLFDALIRTKLVESRSSSNYHRCGRTDKGVSAFGQVISLDVRTNVTNGLGVFTPADYKGTEKETKNLEIDYCGILNRVLPPDIRIIAWSPVKNEFSSRFNCKKRIYKYFIPESNLNINKMREAAQYFVGSHDLGNFCKVDQDKTSCNYIRKIFSVSIDYSFESEEDLNTGYKFLELSIEAESFLWHQIRCIAYILLLIGEEKEEPNLVLQLLNIEQVPNKPQYPLACEIPLMLYDCQYNDEVEWIYDTELCTSLIKHLQSTWTQYAVKAQIIKHMTNNLEHHIKSRIKNQHSPLIRNINTKDYKKILSRPSCGKIQNRINAIPSSVNASRIDNVLSMESSNI